MLSIKTRNLLIIISTLLLLLTGCGLDSNIEQNTAVGIISAQFTDAETGNAIAETEVFVSAAFEGQNELIEQGSITTDTNGEFEANITSFEETQITLLQFTFSVDNNEIVLEENVNLNLTYEEPTDRVDLSFEVETNAEE